MFWPVIFFIVSVIVASESARWMYLNNYNTNIDKYWEKMSFAFILCILSWIMIIASVAWFHSLAYPG